jgi:glycosyltransferase involved in cell wall biosynthesis
MANMRLHVYTSQPQSALRDQRMQTDVVFHGHLPPETIHEVQRRADVLFLPLAFESPIGEVLRTSAPGKMGDYLATGRPILVHAPPDSFVSRYFREHDCGVVVDSNSPNAVAEALKRIATDPSLRQAIGKKARERAQVDFDLAQARRTFRQLVDHIEIS